MKIKENYKVREIAGENLIVEQGKSQSDMTKVIQHCFFGKNCKEENFLWKMLQKY